MFEAVSLMSVFGKMLLCILGIAKKLIALIESYDYMDSPPRYSSLLFVAVLALGSSDNSSTSTNYLFCRDFVYLRSIFVFHSSCLAFIRFFSMIDIVWSLSFKFSLFWYKLFFRSSFSVFNKDISVSKLAIFLSLSKGSYGGIKEYSCSLSFSMFLN